LFQCRDRISFREGVDRAIDDRRAYGWAETTASGILYQPGTEWGDEIEVGVAAIDVAGAVECIGREAGVSGTGGVDFSPDERVSGIVPLESVARDDHSHLFIEVIDLGVRAKATYSGLLDYHALVQVHENIIHECRAGALRNQHAVFGEQLVGLRRVIRRCRIGCQP
jgi:hypothetical protein